MKTKYLKGITALGFLALLFFTSCLKDDSHYFDPLSTTANLAELPLSGLNNFGKDAITKGGIDTITFAVGVTSASLPTSPTTITIGVDNAIVTSYNSANAASSGVTYLPIPTTAFKLASTSIVIPAGKNSVLTTVIIDRNQLDPATSYMLPVKIVDAGGLPISGNYGIHYYHIIGNDFAGIYQWKFQRYNAADSTSAALNGLSFDFSAGNKATFSPISPTEFVVYTGYDGGNVIHYDVKFTKTITGGVASYTNFSVALLPADVAFVLDPANGGITFPQAPVFFVNGKPGSATLPGPYTFAQARNLFHFQFVAFTTASRYIIDTYK